MNSLPDRLFILEEAKLLEDPVALVAGKIQSCQCKEGPFAGLHVVDLTYALVSEHPLFPVGARQVSSFCPALLDPRNKQLIHQLKQPQVGAPTLNQILQGTNTKQL